MGSPHFGQFGPGMSNFKGMLSYRRMQAPLTGSTINFRGTSLQCRSATYSIWAKHSTQIIYRIFLIFLDEKSGSRHRTSDGSPRCMYDIIPTCKPRCSSHSSSCHGSKISGARHLWENVSPYVKAAVGRGGKASGTRLIRKQISRSIDSTLKRPN